MSVVRSGEIKALSGLRIVAAVWVVLFHFRPLLHQASPPLSEALAPILDCGAQGVDLFFILSGFVLTWNYLDRMGPAWSLHDAALPVATAGQGLAGVPGDHASGGSVGDLHPQRRQFPVSGGGQPHRAQLPATTVPGAALGRTVLRRHQLGRAGVVDQRRVVGLPDIRAADTGAFPGGPGHPGPRTAVAGVPCHRAAAGTAGRNGGVLHPVELAAAHRHAITRGRWPVPRCASWS